MNINELQQIVHQNAVDKGFWDHEVNGGEKIALMHSELSEALEELRSGYAADERYYSDGGKPEGVPSELADVIIRVLDFMGYYGVDMEDVIDEKMQYNATRASKHGRSF